MNLNIVVLMAGLGKRFSDVGYTQPKPLIKTNENKTILEWTTTSLPFIRHYNSSLPEKYKDLNYTLTFAIRREHDQNCELTKYLQSVYGPNINIVKFDGPIKGNLDTAASTVEQMSFKLDLNEGLLVLDADNHYDGNCVFDNIIDLKSFFSGPSAMVFYFEPLDNSEKWCFVTLDENTQRINRISEKKKITSVLENYPLIGTFYFSSANFFLRYAYKVLATPEYKVNGEFYLSKCVQCLLENYYDVFGCKITNVCPLGTPEDLKLFEAPKGPFEMPDINSVKRICFDLDETICFTKKQNERYEDVLPLPGAIETLQQLKKDGWYIIIQTARNMRTYQHNTGLVNAKQTKIIVDWLEKHQIPFDELHTKPHVSLFFDDKARQFTTWEQATKDIEEFKKQKGIV